VLLADILDSGDLPGRHGKPNRARASELYDYMRKRARPLQYWSDKRFAKFLKGVGATPRRSNGAVWDFPPLPEARARFRKERPWWPPFEPGITNWDCDFEDEDEGV
jgi:hypothetical protein